MAKQIKLESKAARDALKWVQRKQWPSVEDSNGTLSIVDLFCGCGGLTLGAWEAARQAKRKLDIRLAVDFDDDALAVYRDNFKVDDSISRSVDITELISCRTIGNPTNSERALAKSVGKLDLLVAGPPCQGHSDLNNHSRRDDPRNGLYMRAVRGVVVLKPSVAIIENVPTVIHDIGKVVERAYETLEHHGYTVSDVIVSAQRFGLPQRRKRHLLVAMKDTSINLEEWVNGLPDNKVPLGPFFKGLENEPGRNDELFYNPSRMTPINVERTQYLFDHALYDLPNSERPECHLNGHSYVSMYGRLRRDKPAQTLTTGFGSMGQGRFVHPTRMRTITPHEAARIQGFPDFFQFDTVSRRTSLHSMIGNAVPIRFGELLAMTINHHGDQSGKSLAIYV